jgi:hypothetical protein
MAEFNPMNLASALSKISGAFGGEGLVWRGTQSGLVNRAIQKFAKSQAESTTEAGSKMGMMNLLGKGASLLTMMYAPWSLPGKLAAGALAGGAVSGIGQKYFADQLSREDVAKYMPEGQRPLYGLDEASEIESTAHSAIDKLQASVVPTALETAITTPLQYMTYKMSQSNPYLSSVSDAPKFAAGDLSKQFVAGQDSYRKMGFGDLLSFLQKGMTSGGDIDMSQNPYDWGSYLKNPYMRLNFPSTRNLKK